MTELDDMAGNAMGRYVNLLQRMAIAISDGKADAKVERVPVSRTPYVRVTLDADFDACEAIRQGVRLSLAERGFRRVDDTHMAHEGDGGWIDVEISSAWVDPATHRAVMDLTPYGPYEVVQRYDGLPRDIAAERRAFEADLALLRRDADTRLQGVQGLTRWALMSLPFPAVSAELNAIAGSGEMTVHRRAILALARQGLESWDAFIERAGLGDVVGREPSDPEDAPASPGLR